MSKRHQIAPQKTQTPMRLVQVSFALLALGLSGCHHKPIRAVLPLGVLAPVELETVPEPEVPTEVTSLPAPDFGPLPPPAPPPKPPQRRRPAPSEQKEEPQTQPSTQVAQVEPEAALGIGVLTAGSDTSGQSLQQAKDLIASIVKRIAELPPKVASSEKKQVRQVQNTIKQAQQAVNSGDGDGAMTLATKAKLLMDDLEKK